MLYYMLDYDAAIFYRVYGVLLYYIDPNCVQLCSSHGFDCYNYVHPALKTDNTGVANPGAKPPHMMEQIATVKMFHVDKLLARGVHVMLLDLDVGFLKDPALLYKGYEGLYIYRYT